MTVLTGRGLSDFLLGEGEAVTVTIAAGADGTTRTEGPPAPGATMDPQPETRTAVARVAVNNSAGRLGVMGMRWG